MFNFRISPNFFSNYISALKSYHRHEEKLTSLAENPFAIAKPIGKPLFGDYYIKLGNKYCLVFNIDEANQEIILLYTVHRTYLYKVMIGRLTTWEYPDDSDEDLKE